MNFIHQDYAQMDDLRIERQGHTITKIVKSGVVIWPMDQHTAAMQPTDSQRTLAHQTNEVFESANSGMWGGNHYHTPSSTGTCPKCGATIQHWDWAHNLKGLEYAATKYIGRWREKGGLESIKKAIHYLQKLIEIHFPGTSVTVQYSNQVDAGRKVEACEGMAGGQTSHQAAVESEQERYARLCRESAKRVKGDIY